MSAAQGDVGLTLTLMLLFCVTEGSVLPEFSRPQSVFSSPFLCEVYDVPADRPELFVALCVILEKKGEYVDSFLQRALLKMKMLRIKF